jgi:pimeloyl-ACP methyl ester carboxylesterase
MRWCALAVAAVLVWAGSLRAQPADPERTFAEIFNAVLTGENPDGGLWSGADAYLEAAGESGKPSQATIRRVLQKPIRQYRVLIVPGFMSACSFTESATAGAFYQALEHLKTAHGVDAQLLQVPDDSCENNGKLITQYLREHPGPKFIVVGHSKGAADLQMALQDRAAADRVVAFVSIAGAVGGSPLADLAEGRGLLRHVEVSGGCVGKLGAALDSIQTTVRHVFADSHPDSPVPSYSLVAASTFAGTSKILLPTWGLLGAGFRGKEDGMLMAADGTLPGAKFLGTALADHVAVAHDFEQTRMAKLYDKGYFPRAALLEAVVRFIEAE